MQRQRARACFVPKVLEELARVHEQQRVVAPSEPHVDVRLELAADRVLLVRLNL